MCLLVTRLHLSLFIRSIVIFNVIVFFLGYLYRFGRIVRWPTSITAKVSSQYRTIKKKASSLTLYKSFKFWVVKLIFKSNKT